MPQIATVAAVDYGNARVQVSNSSGTRWAYVMKGKTSNVLAGEIDLPNVGDVGVIVGLNGDTSSVAWLGSLNVVNLSRTLEHDSNFVSAADLVHRLYRKHESQSFWWLKKLGDFMLSFMKKATLETDTPQPNLSVSLQGGVVVVTHYRGANKTSFTFTADQAGNYGFKLYEDDGVTVAYQTSSDKNGNVAVASKGTYGLTSVGLAQINGGQFVAYTSALAQLKAQHDALAVAFNAQIAHTHISAVPGNPTGAPSPVEVAVPSLPLTTPIGTSKTKVG